MWSLFDFGKRRWWVFYAVFAALGFFGIVLAIVKPQSLWVAIGCGFVCHVIAQLIMAYGLTNTRWFAHNRRSDNRPVLTGITLITASASFFLEWWLMSLLIARFQ